MNTEIIIMSVIFVAALSFSLFKIFGRKKKNNTCECSHCTCGKNTCNENKLKENQ